MATVSMTVNGKSVTADVDPRTLLVQFLRENLRLTGTHVGCDTSQCGACVVHLNGQAVKACTILALQADACVVTTIEGLAKAGELHPMQAAFREHHGLQCGFCTPGMIMSAVDIVNRKGPGLEERRSGPSLKAICAAARATTTSSRLSPQAPRRWRGRRPRLPPSRCARRARRNHGVPRAETRNADEPRSKRHTSGASFELFLSLRHLETRRRKSSGRTTMSATGIGAPVRRKEDQRFVTGQGRYVDDFNRPGQAHAYFLRSPHAHATIRVHRHECRQSDAGRASQSSPAMILPPTRSAG